VRSVPQPEGERKVGNGRSPRVGNLSDQHAEAFTGGVAMVRVRRWRGSRNHRRFFWNGCCPRTKTVSPLRPASVMQISLLRRSVTRSSGHIYEQEDPTRLNGARSLKEFREQLFDRCFWLKVLWDTADADKHRFLTRSNTTRLIDSSTAAYSGTGNVLLLGGSAFLPMLEAAVDFWRNWQD
jgi:hypothetical protein